jgi:hypothetical protein
MATQKMKNSQATMTVAEQNQDEEATMNTSAVVGAWEFGPQAAHNSGAVSCSESARPGPAPGRESPRRSKPSFCSTEHLTVLHDTERPTPNIAMASNKVKVLFHGKGGHGASCCKMWQ